MVLFLWLAFRRAFPAPPPPHRRYAVGSRTFFAPPATPAIRGRFLMVGFCLVVGSALPLTVFLRVFLAPYPDR